MGTTALRAEKIKKFMFKTLILNVVLSVVKLFTGIFGKSAALISDAVNSISDIFASLVGIIGIKLSAKKADKEHPYGHERFEGLFALVLAAIILFTAIEIIRRNVTDLIAYFNGDTDAISVPNYIAIIGASIALLIKVGVYLCTRKMAKIHNSPILKADALNHFGDIFSTLGGLIAIVGAMFGLPYLDNIGSIIIALFIIRVAVGIAMSSVNQLVDEAADEETEACIRKTIYQYIEETQLDVLKTRQHGVRVYVDLEISLPKDYTLEKAHAIAENIAQNIKVQNPTVKKAMVHVNPKY